METLVNSIELQQQAIRLSKNLFLGLHNLSSSKPSQHMGRALIHKASTKEVMEQEANTHSLGNTSTSSSNTEYLSSNLIMSQDIITNKINR